MRDVKRHGIGVVLKLLAMGVRQPGEAAHPHADCEVAALNVQGRDVLHFRVAGDLVLASADALGGAVATAAARVGIGQTEGREDKLP